MNTTPNINQFIIECKWHHRRISNLNVICVRWDADGCDGCRCSHSKHMLYDADRIYVCVCCMLRAPDDVADVLKMIWQMCWREHIYIYIWYVKCRCRSDKRVRRRTEGEKNCVNIQYLRSIFYILHLLYFIRCIQNICSSCYRNLLLENSFIYLFFFFYSIILCLASSVVDVAARRNGKSCNNMRSEKFLSGINTRANRRVRIGWCMLRLRCLAAGGKQNRIVQYAKLYFFKIYIPKQH